MTSPPKRRLGAALAVATLELLVSAPADAKTIEQRKKHQEQRIENGEKSGKLSPEEASKLRVGGDGELRLLVKGKGANLSLPPLGFSTPVTLALVVEDATGTSCWRATFAAALRNDATVFKAVSP